MRKFNLLSDELSDDYEREHIRKYINEHAYRSSIHDQEYYASVSKIFICRASSNNSEETDEILIDTILEDNEYKEYILKNYK